MDWNVKAELLINRRTPRNTPGGDVRDVFKYLEQYVGKYYHFVGQTQWVNEAFFKAANQYKKGIQRAYRTAGIGIRSGALYSAIDAKRGKPEHRPSAMLFAGGGKGSRHRWPIEAGFTPGFSDEKQPAKKYVEPGMKQANTAAVNAAVNYVRKHIDDIIQQAKRYGGYS